MPTLDIAQYSREAGEPLTASAPYTSLWLLLEYDDSWEAKALSQNSLPEAVKNLLVELSQTLPNARVQFIKRKREPDGINFYVAHAHPLTPLLYHFRLNRYEDLLDMDFTALATAHSEQTLSEERLFLICTNGKRDICCAKQGVPLYRAMSTLDEPHVWETIHFGGHRLAATLVCLPHGLCYGRVPVTDAAAIIHSYQQNLILPQYYRGNVAYDAPAQAVEAFLREQTGEQAVDAFRLIDFQPDGENRWRVTFEAANGVSHKLAVRAEVSSFSVYGSTSDPEPRPVTLYVVET